ncbi:unnamed protein product [Arctia plantaginis]|uniref:Sphingomyelin phosphodiesterase n=1 Tax=Arctia plantaginis TaxID=874455 RepID=A0A8S0YTE1_ARCPL|nr:unnamed protein product [Arctia plantaginis]
MRVFIFMITVLASAFATQLLSSDHLEELFRKYARNELSTTESRQFSDVLDILRRPEYASFLSLEKSSQPRLTLDCLICRSGFTTVFSAVEEGRPDEEIIDVVKTLCYNLGVGSYNMCSGIAELNMPIITYIIRTTPEATPRTFCGHIFQNAENSNACQVNDPRFEWTIDLPPPPATTPPPVNDPTPLKIALITDAHIDPLYEAYGVAQCVDPTCCRKGQILAQNFEELKIDDEYMVEEAVVDVNGETMLNLSVASNLREIRKLRNSPQIQLPTKSTPEPAGYWGDYRNCDTPIWAFDDVIDRIAETHKDIDLVYYVGDTIDHHIWETTYDLITEMNGYLIKKMRSSFGDHVPIVPTIGNHESQPTNQFAPSTVTEENLNTTWLYHSLAKKWDHYLTEDAKKTLRERGEFSMVVRPGLRVISLNTNVAYRYNWWLSYDPLDAKIHLEWLVKELYEAEAAGEKVHIITHIPPGVVDLTHTWTREYNRIVNRFTATIAAEFNGHTHTDQFKIFFNQEGRPINVAWGGGSATSFSFYNLNYKILDMNPVTYEPERIVNYIYNLTEANLTPNRRPHWFQLYDMKNTFQLPDLSPESMYDLIRKMADTHPQLLEVYAAFHPKLSGQSACDADCQFRFLCNTVVTVLWDRQRCEELRNLRTKQPT